MRIEAIRPYFPGVEHVFPTSLDYSLRLTAAILLSALAAGA